MFIRTYIQGHTIDLYTSGYDLSQAGTRLDLSNPATLPAGVQNSQQFVEQLLHYNPAIAHRLSSSNRFSQQADIQDQFEQGQWVAVYPKETKPHKSQKKSWLETGSITLDIKNAIAQRHTPKQPLTPIPPRLSRVISNDSSEKKAPLVSQLIIEVAGQNLTQSQYLSLNKTVTDSAKKQTALNDNQRGHRSLVHFQQISETPRTLSLSINMTSEPSPLQLPLTTQPLKPSNRSLSKAEYDNVLIPIKPFLHHSTDKAITAANQLSDGWLYVFWKGSLWRELDVSQEGTLRDCRVAWYRNQIRFGQHNHDAAREAEGHGLDNIWLPYKINNEYQLGHNGLRIAFSETQWTWNHIEALEANAEHLTAQTTSLDGIKQYSEKQHFDSASDSINAIEITMKTSQSKQSIDVNKPAKIAAICLTPEPNTLFLKINDHNLAALAGKRYQLIAGKNTLEGTLPANGIINEPIPNQAAEGELRIWCNNDSDSPSHRIPIKLGQLASIGSPAGIQARLNNLNHHAGVIDGITGRKTLAAIKQFQQQNHLTVDGDVGPITRSKLRDIHGS